MMIDNESIEFIEERLDADRTNVLCANMLNISHQMWGLTLRKCEIDVKNFKKIIKAARNCEELRYLNLNLSPIRIESLSLLSSVLANFRQLNTLCLHSCGIGDQGIKLLHKSLISLPSFKSLDIGDCNLTDLCIPYVRETIHRSNQENGLVELTMSANQNMTPAGWAKIFIAVAASDSMKKFDADFNRLDDNCGYLIVAILSANQSIRSLDLECTGLTNKTAQMIFYVLRHYELILENLNLVNNPIDQQLVDSIEAFVSNDYSLNMSKSKAGLLNLNLNSKDRKKLDEYIRCANRLNQDRSRNKANAIKQYEKDLLNQQQQQQKQHQQKPSKKNQVRDIEMDTLINDDNNNNNNNNNEEYYKTHSVLPFNLKKHHLNLEY